jgi:mono/diheme cytochrome c family protein
MRARVNVALTWTGILMLVVPLAFETAAGAQRLPWPNVGEDPIVTPVAGPSWVTHLGIQLSDTSLGKGAGRYGPGADQSPQNRYESTGVRRTIQAAGADLYRFNCQACHRAEGTGDPPEIHSLLRPVQGSSVALVRKQLRERLGSSNEKTARVEANRARATVLARMHQGGRRMPPRDYLQEDEMRVLFAYLTQLAGMPDAARQSTRVISWARLGELVVKGTCHICHDAVGPSPTGQELLRGSIPSLDSVLRTKRIAEFVHKVRNGEVVSLEDPVFKHRGRMPVFYYLRDEEAAAAYVYLATYPPRDR